MKQHGEGIVQTQTPPSPMGHCGKKEDPQTQNWEKKQILIEKLKTLTQEEFNLFVSRAFEKWNL